MKRFVKVLAVVAIVVAVAGCYAIGQLGGAYKHEPEEAAFLMSDEAQALVDAAYEGIEPGALRDYHSHLITIGTSGSGGYVNPHMLDWKHPMARIKAAVYMSGAGVDNLDNADAEFLARKVRLIRALPNPSRHYILGFDKYYRPDGTVNDAKTEFFTPNSYVFEVAERYPDVFLPAISVHPYRADAMEALQKWHAKGARLIKWLPNAQGMDPADPKLDEYYKFLAANDMVLMTHVGEEQAVKADEDQALGNPLKFRRALDLGVTIIMAHCGSLGTNVDLDDPAGKRVSSFDLFLRLMADEKYKGQLYGDLSAMTQFNRLPTPIAGVLNRPELHDRLVNGSDYPLPALNVVIRLGDLIDHGLLDESLREPMREIYDYNPLLFDFVLKRNLKAPGTGAKLPASVFMKNPALPMLQ